MTVGIRPGFAGRRQLGTPLLLCAASLLLLEAIFASFEPDPQHAMGLTWGLAAATGLVTVVVGRHLDRGGRVLVSVVTLLLLFEYFIAQGLIEFGEVDAYLPPSDPIYVFRAQVLAVAGFASMMIGFVVVDLLERHRPRGLLSAAAARLVWIDRRVMLVIAGLGLGVRVFLVVAGLDGFFASSAGQPASQFLQFGRIVGDLGMLAFFSLAIMAYRSNRRGDLPLVMALAAGFSLAGLLSGFKGAVMLPWFALVIAAYLGRGRLNWGLLAVALAAISVSYQIVEPMRRMAGTEAGLLELATRGATRRDEVPAAELVARVVARLDLAAIAGLSMALADDGRVPELQEQLRIRFELAPLMAVVPRFAWPTKPENNLGQWITKDVMGRVDDDGTSVAAGAVASAYLVGGRFLVYGFFLFVGAFIGLLNALHRRCPDSSGAAAVVMVIALSSCMVDTAGYTYVVGAIWKVGLFALLVLIGSRLAWRQRWSDTSALNDRATG